MKLKLVGKQVHIPPDPVQDIQTTVGTQGKDIVRGDRFCLAQALQQKHLRQNGDGLEEDTVRPEDFLHIEFVVEEKRKDRRGTQQPFQSDRIDVRLVTSPDM